MESIIYYFISWGNHFASMLFSQTQIDRHDLKQSRYAGFAPSRAMFRLHLGTTPFMNFVALIQALIRALIRALIQALIQALIRALIRVLILKILFSNLRLVLNLGELTDLLKEGQFCRPWVASAPRLLQCNWGKILKGCHGMKKFHTAPWSPWNLYPFLW